MTNEEAFLIKIKSLVDKKAPAPKKYDTVWDKFGVSKDEFDRLAKEAKLNPFKNDFDKLNCKECGQPLGKHYGDGPYEAKCNTYTKAPTPFSPNSVKMIVKSVDTGRERELGTFQNTALAMNHINLFKKTHPMDMFTVISEGKDPNTYKAYIFKTDRPIKANGLEVKGPYFLHLEKADGTPFRLTGHANYVLAKKAYFDFKNAGLEIDVTGPRKVTLQETVSEIMAIARAQAHDEVINESYIHDQIKKAMKKIWKAIGSPDMPKMAIPEFMANIDLFTVKKILGANNELIPYFDNLDPLSKIALAKEAFA